MTIAQEIEIDALRKRVEELEARPLVEEFAREFLENLGAALAWTPFDQWPRIAKVAFRHTARKLPIQAQMYKGRLPD